MLQTIALGKDSGSQELGTVTLPGHEEEEPMAGQDSDGHHTGDTGDTRPSHLPVREGLSAAGDASAELLATMFADTYNEPWEDAVRRYDTTHTASSRSGNGEP
jgi:hypothetical protein